MVFRVPIQGEATTKLNIDLYQPWQNRPSLCTQQSDDTIFLKFYNTTNPKKMFYILIAMHTNQHERFICMTSFENIKDI